MISDSRFRRIRVERISLDRELDYRSKLDRKPAFVEELREHGKTKWRRFLKERESERMFEQGRHEQPSVEGHPL